PQALTNPRSTRSHHYKVHKIRPSQKSYKLPPTRGSKPPTIPWATSTQHPEAHKIP
ncbi:uncharacterized, partial [Tachysurus ichikawai]